MIRDMGNVELLELCETIPKVQSSECLLYWNQGLIYRQNSSQWRPHGARHGKNEAQKNIFCVPQRAEEMDQFTIVSYETQYIVIRNSKLAGPSKSGSKWRNWHRKTTPTIYLERNV